MSYPKKLLRLRPLGGLALDVPAAEVGPEFYTGGDNIDFRIGYARRTQGERAVYTQSTANPALHLLNVRAPGGITESNFWLVFGDDDVNALETSNIDLILTGLTPVTSAWQWASTLLNNIPCWTNGLDVPYYWAGDVGVAAAALPGWPVGTVCKSLIAFQFHLFALDIDGPGGHLESQFLWSDAAPAGSVPSTWTAASTNEAGDGILADTPGPIMCGAPLGGSLLLFKRASTYAIDYIGGERVFRARLLDGDRGALTRHSIVDVGGQMFVVSDGEVYLTDGTTWTPIAFGRTKEFLFSQLSQDSYENLYVVHHRARGEVWVCYPESGFTYPRRALVYHTASNEWSRRDLDSAACAEVGIVNDLSADESWDADAEEWDADGGAWNSANFSLATEQLISGTADDDLTLYDDETATTRDATLFRHDLTMGAPERLKFVRRVHVRTTESSGTLYVRVGSRMSTTDAITWDDEQALDAPDSFVNTRALGRYISVEVRSQDDDVWGVHGFDIEYEERGYL